MFIDFVCFVQNKNWSPYKTYHHKTYLFKTYQRQNLSNYKTYQTTKLIKQNLSITKLIKLQNVSNS